MFCDCPEAFVSADVSPPISNGLQVIQMNRKERKGIFISVRIHRNLIEHEIELESICEARCRIRERRIFVPIRILLRQGHRSLRSDYFQTSKRFFIELVIRFPYSEMAPKTFPSRLIGAMADI